MRKYFCSLPLLRIERKKEGRTSLRVNKMKEKKFLHILLILRRLEMRQRKLRTFRIFKMIKCRDFVLWRLRDDNFFELPPRLSIDTISTLCRWQIFIFFPFSSRACLSHSNVMKSKVISARSKVLEKNSVFSAEVQIWMIIKNSKPLGDVFYVLIFISQSRKREDFEKI